MCQKVFLQFNKKTGDDGKISDGHVSIKDCIVCERIWDRFNIKNMGEYYIILKKMYYCWHMYVKSLLVLA